MGEQVEIEVKYILPGGADEAAGLIRRISALAGPAGRKARHTARHFEDNYLLDYPGAPIRRQGCGLRLRLTPLADTVTWKGAVQPDPRLKIREEIEVGVEEGRTLLTILQKIGLRTIFRYQKYRQVFQLGNGLAAVIDETPFGWFTELEGPAAEIERVVQELELKPENHIKASYAGYFAMELERRGQKGESEVVFPEQRLEQDRR
jgi:predicted adenylyl cyclase CyaB